MEITDFNPRGGFEEEHYGITEKQACVAYEMVRCGRPVSEILAEHSVTEEEFTSWVRDGRFSEYASALASGFAQADAPYVWNSLIASAKEGNMQAIKLYFDIWSKRQGAKTSPAGNFLADGEIESLRADVFGEAE